MGRRYYVLRADAFDLDFLDEMLDALDALARARGLRFGRGFYEQLSDGLGRHVYLEADGRAVIRLVVDFKTPVRYLVVEAVGEPDAGRIGAWLGEHLRFVPVEELRRAARAGESPGALVRLALGSGAEADAEAVQILTEGLRAGDERVRLAAVEAAGVTQWPEFAAPLAEVVAGDESDAARSLAATALEACRRRDAKGVGEAAVGGETDAGG